MPQARPHKTLLSNTELESRIREIAREIDAAYSTSRDVVLLCVLTGALPFFEALSDAVSIPHRRAFVRVSSYGMGTRLSSGNVRVLQPISESLLDADVIIVEDIIDTGHSMRVVLDLVKAEFPKSAAVAALLSKPSRRVVEVPEDFLGFRIHDHFVFGYGIDVDQQYRDLDYIGYFE